MATEHGNLVLYNKLMLATVTHNIGQQPISQQLSCHLSSKSTIQSNPSTTLCAGTHHLPFHVRNLDCFIITACGNCSRSLSMFLCKNLQIRPHFFTPFDAQSSSVGTQSAQCCGNPQTSPAFCGAYFLRAHAERPNCPRCHSSRSGSCQ